MPRLAHATNVTRLSKFGRVTPDPPDVIVVIFSILVI